MNRRISGAIALVVGVAAARAGAGCGDTTDESRGNAHPSGSTGVGGKLFDDDGGMSSTGSGVIDPDAACATSNSQATLVPVNMFIMFDKSGSMNDNGKWPACTAALKAFFQDPATAGLRVALRFFPDDGCDDVDCSIDACSQPLVALGPLTVDPAPTDAQEQALVSAVDSKGPDGHTPMFAALGGAEQWAAGYLAAHPTEKVVVVLVTDGEPHGCDEDIDHIAQLAGDGLGNGVYTYAVGLEGSNEAQMNQIAQAGGTMQGIFIGNGNAQAELLAALKAIQGSQVACAFQVPTPPNGETLDPKLVNVNYTPGGGMTTTLGQVPSAADCGPAGGWYYDNPTNPTTITLCPATCAVVQGDDQAKLDILFGCSTQEGEIH